MIEEKLELLKKQEWDEPDKDLIQGWEDLLRDIKNNEEYLGLPLTRKIVKELKGMVQAIDDSLKSMLNVNPSELYLLNDTLARKQAYLNILHLFNADEDYTALREHLEQQVDEALQYDKS